MSESSNNNVEFNKKALSRAMGRAYADSAYREALVSDPSATLTATGVLEKGEVHKVTMSSDMKEWEYQLEQGEEGNHLLLGVPDMSEELGEGMPEDNVAILCCCCCPC